MALDINKGQTPPCLADIKAAAERIEPYVTRTPLLREEDMDEYLGCEVYLKPEMLQVSGAFKARGAFNKILLLDEEDRKKGIIFSSSGNHAAACAYAGKKFGIDAYAVMPFDTPKGKVDNCIKRGGHPILWERDYPSRIKKVEDEMNEHGYSLVHGFIDYGVMCGQGTIGLEILEDLPDVDYVLAPIGGGGLMSGLSTAIKESNPKVKVIGVQAAASCACAVSFKNGARTQTESTETLADGINSSNPAEDCFNIIYKYCDDVVTVGEESIAEAVKLIGSTAHLVAEPTSAVVIAALLEKKIAVKPEDKVACLLTSGNYDIDLIGRFFKGENVDPVAAH